MKSGQSTDTTDRATRKDSWFLSGPVRLWSAFCPPVAVLSPALSACSAFFPPVQRHELRQLARLEIRHDPVVDVVRPPVHHVIAARTRGRLVLVTPRLRPRVHVDQVLSPPV